ncbi:hypothetical protein IJ732_01430, partial [bacterium]|nr:hypothetical protein [bacterium]
MGALGSKGSQGADFALEDKGALGLNTSEDADLGSQNCGALGSKGSQGADFALEDKGALGLNVREDADLGSQNFGALGSNLSKDADFALENFNGASKTRHSETPNAGSESVNDRHLKSALNAKDTLCIGALLHRRQIFDWKHHALVLISYV